LTSASGDAATSGSGETTGDSAAVLGSSGVSISSRIRVEVVAVIANARNISAINIFAFRGMVVERDSHRAIECFAI